MAGGTSDGPARNPRGKFARSAASVRRDNQSAALRAKGWTFDRIAAELGYASRGKAKEGYDRAIAEIPTEGAEEAKRLDLERIDMLIAAAWVVLEAHHVTVSQGKIVGRFAGFMKDPDTGETLRNAEGDPIAVYDELEDDGPVLNAIDRIERLVARREKIIGYAAPARVKVQVITDEDLEDEAAGLRGDIAGLEAEAADGPDAGPGVA